MANGYEEGDTWYRDMRVPGFSVASQAPEGQDSLQWLVRRRLSLTRVLPRQR